MKKSVLLGIVALGAVAVSAYGQGYVSLDNYLGGGTLLTYGDAITPANGVSGAPGGIGNSLGTGWTVGLYFVGGTTGLSQGAGSGLPDSSLALGTGIGSTVGVADAGVGGQLGLYSSGPVFNSGSTANSTITLEVVVYSGSSYATALYRGHSAAFSMPTAAATSASFPTTGASMPGTLSVVAVVPEPTTMALGGLGLASLLLFRRKQA